MPAANQRASPLLSIEQILNPHPLTVVPGTTVAVLVELMSQTKRQACDLSGLEPDLVPSNNANCALIVADSQLLGIFTERDLVRLIAEGRDLETVVISEVMTQPVTTVRLSEAQNFFGLLTTMKQHRIRQLPVVDEAKNLLGIVTQSGIREAMQPLNFLKLRRVGEVMTRAAIQAEATECVLRLAQRMTQHRVSCLVITETKQQRGFTLRVPVGIVTERDILQFRALGLSLAKTSAQAAMSAPLYLVHPQDSLWTAHQQMLKRHTRRLVVADEAGGLAGLVTQTDLLQALDPMTMLEEIEQRQQLSEIQALRLNTANQQLLQTNQKLQIAVAERKRLEAALQHAHRVLEERVGFQAAQLVQTDEALRQEVQERQRAQDQLEQFFAVTPSLLCIAGLDGYFKLLNPSFSQILGYDNSELLSKPFIDFVHPDDRTATQAEVERLGAGQLTIAFENRYRCKDGGYRWLSWNATADSGKQIIYAAARDVTEHKRFEDALKRERDFISAVLDTVGALIIVLDRSGRVIRFNCTCEQVSGYTADEICGQQIWDILIPPEERAEIQAIFKDLRHGIAPNQHENYWLRKDGDRKLICWSNTVLRDASDTVEYVIGTGIDVTNQRQIEQNLARQHLQGRLLGEITCKIRDSLNIEAILQIAVTEVRKLLGCDRVVIIECGFNNTGKVIQESIGQEDSTLSILDRVASGLKLMTHPHSNTPHACSCEDLASAPCSLYTTEFLNQCDARSCVEVAIYAGNQFWGVITAIQSDRSRRWEAFEIELMEQLANQMGVAISQAQLLDNLEAQVDKRTKQLIKTNSQLTREIQERIQIENALRESQQKLEGILDNADEAIISIDHSQKIVLYNQGAERIFGYSSDEALGQPLDILLPKAFQQIHRQHVRNFAASSETARQMAERSREVFGQRNTGEAFPAEASISKLNTKAGQLFTVMLKDITERRRSEAALRRSEEQLRLTTDALPVLICSVDTEQRYCFNNRTYEDWFKIPAADLRGRHIQEVMGNEYYAELKAHIEAALSGQQVSFESELTTPDGQSRYLLATYIPEVDEHDNIKGFFGLTHDISDRKATERLKDEFVSVVGHELRTPLTSIHGSLKLLASKKLGTLTPQGQEFLEIALKNTQRLTRLVNDVLDLERIESGRITMSMRRCHLADLIMQAVQAMQAMADEQHVRLTVEALEVTTARVDPDHIAQVLTNLISNAIKFSSANTTIWLGAVKREEDILIYVKDQGRGIPPDKLETIFERFQQVDASDSRQLGGTGLGLAICKNIVQRHGGRIWAESTFGEGSTFFFTLPDVREQGSR